MTRAGMLVGERMGREGPPAPEIGTPEIPVSECKAQQETNHPYTCTIWPVRKFDV